MCKTPVFSGFIKLKAHAAIKGLYARVLVQKALAHTDALRGYLDKLIVGDKLHALLQAHGNGRRKAQRLVRARSAHVGNVLFLADVYDDILVARAFTHDLPFINGYAGTYEQSAALLRVKESIAAGIAGFVANERAALTFLNIALIRLKIMK